MDSVSLGREPVAVFTALASPGLRGNEAGLDGYLGAIIRKAAPNWKIVDAKQMISLMNERGLAGDYVRMRADAEQSYVLDRDLLRKLGAAIGARFVFQPRLAYFYQGFQDRFSVPIYGVKVVQTRESTLRMSLTLWDTSNGKLLWNSVAEANLQSEAINQDPVFFEDAARVAIASMLSDLLNRKTSSKYTPYNVFIDDLMRESVPQNSNGGRSGGK